MSLLTQLFDTRGLGTVFLVFLTPFVFIRFITAVQVALLTIYDMYKAVDRDMMMGNIKLLEKSRGKSGELRLKKGRQPKRHREHINFNFVQMKDKK